MIDLHTHTVFSDGELIPSELIRRAETYGYRAIGLTDHVDFTNVEHVISCVSKAKELEDVLEIRIIPGVEITHVPPSKMAKLAKIARDLGAEIIVVHGETPTEPVASGTNRAAIDLGADILAHPGFITQEEAEAAFDMNVCLEITSRLGHNITNGHVVRMAKAAKAKLLVDTDTHSPDDLITSSRAIQIAMGAGLTLKDATTIVKQHPIIDI